jgi:SNF2 family DNA or RNA helicase
MSRKATMGGFEGRYTVKGGFMGREIKSFCNLDEMHRIMARNAVVARKEDVLDLPPVTNIVVPVRLEEAEQRAYDELMNHFVTRLASGELATADGFLAQLMKLRQVTSGFVSDDQGRMHRVGQSKAKAIVSIVHDSLLGEKRVVVFCLFVAEIAALASMLARQGTRVEVITGATAPEDRARIRADFGGDSPDRIVLVCQVRTMSIAVNELVTASHAVFGSLSQLRDDFVQARDRLNRTGQKRPVTFWYALGTGPRGGKTADGVILASHQERSDLEAQMLRYVKEYEASDD